MLLNPLDLKCSESDILVIHSTIVDEPAHRNLFIPLLADQIRKSQGKESFVSMVKYISEIYRVHIEYGGKTPVIDVRPTNCLDIALCT